MGAIAFSRNPDESWVVAGWAFRQILDDTALQHPEDSGMAEQFDKAKAIGGLMVYLLEPALATRITAAITYVAAGIISGTVRSGISDKPYGDDRTFEQYRGGLAQLLEAIRLFRTSEATSPESRVLEENDSP